VVDFINNVVPGGSISGTFVTKATDLKKNELAHSSSTPRPFTWLRTGYTGEDGFEIIAPAEVIEAVWTRSLAAASRLPAPARTLARATRCARKFVTRSTATSLMKTHSYRSGRRIFVSLDKGGFVGREVLAGQKASGTKRKLVAFKMTEKSAPPRPHYPIWENGSAVGEVVSGTPKSLAQPRIGPGLRPGAVRQSGNED